MLSLELLKAQADVTAAEENIKLYFGGTRSAGRRLADLQDALSRAQANLNAHIEFNKQAIQESRKPETFEAIPPGDVPKMTQTNDILKFAAIVAGILVLSS